MADSARDIPNPMRPLTRLIENTLTVADIVGRPLWCLNPRVFANDALDAMMANGFDIAGVTGQPVKHFVSRTSLEAGSRRVDKVMEPILASQCVERTLPIGDLLKIFRETDYVFVLEGSEVRWIVNHADLSTTAVSISVLAHLAAIEEGLKIIASKYPEADVLPTMTAGLKKARNIYESRNRGGLETSLLDCFNFGDWISFVKNTEPVRRKLGFSSKKSFKDYVGSMVQLRNDTAHGRGILANTSTTDALRRVEKAIDFARTVWQVVDEQQPIWDRFADSVITYPSGNRRPLAGTNARTTWPWEGSSHVLTAHNPSGIWATDDRNQESNLLLLESLTRHGFDSVPVVGRSMDGDWREPSFLVHGMTREFAAEMGARFGQSAIFELDATILRVVRCSDGAVVRTRERVSPGK